MQSRHDSVFPWGTFTVNVVGSVVLGAVAAAVVVEGALLGAVLSWGIYRVGVFVLGFAFMCFGYSGDSALSTRLLPFALIGLFCAMCAIALGALVHVIRSRIGSHD